MKLRVFRLRLIFWLTLTVYLGMPACHALDPQRDYTLHPSDYGLDYSEQRLETDDGFSLNSWLIRPAADIPASRSVYVIAYGDAGNMGFTLAYAALLARQGHYVLTFDYRGFGASDDFPMDTTMYFYHAFARDLETALRYARSLTEVENVGLLSFSMGTIMGALASAEEPFDFWVCEGLVTDPRICIRRIETLRDEELRRPRKINRSKKLLKKLDIPILVFAATRDPITTLADAEHFAAEKEQREVVPVAADHLQCAAVLGPGRYVETMEAFRRRHLAH